MSVADLYDDLIRDVAVKLSKQFSEDMFALFQEDSDAFTGRSTKEEWISQVENAEDALADAIQFEVEDVIQQIESQLHCGDFLDASVACRSAGLVV